MKQNNHFSRKDIPHNLTPKNININKNTKSINYNKSNSNNNTNLYNSNINLPNNILKEPEFTIENNNSDINFYSSSSSLKDQILSPGDDDLYLYPTINKNIKYQNNQFINTLNNNNNNGDKNKQNYNNEVDTNYYLNFNMNTASFKSIDNNNKKTLILDLDETLVHSSFHPLYFEGELIQPDLFFTILFENKTHDVYVLKRPYIKEFLNKMSKIFNIYIFTASIKEYASPLLVKLDEKKLISKALFRENCTLSKDNKYIKDLHILEENLKNVILIDNNPNSYRYNKCNGIPIKTWHYDKNDKELIKIIPFLTFLALVEDVREYIPKVIDDDQVNYNKIKNIINNSTINNIIKKDNKNKRIINKIKKHKVINNNSYNNTNNNINNNILSASRKIKYYPSYTNNEENKSNITGNKNNKKESQSCNKIIKEKEENNNDNNNNYNNKINFNNFEERKNNNNNTALNNKKNNHNPATINFREPIAHFQSSIFAGYNSPNDNNNTNKNNMIINNGNININKTNRNEDNDINKYQRSKSSNNFNELTRTIHKFSSINFNLMNSQSNNNNINKNMKYSVDSKNIQQNINNKNNELYQIYENKNMTEKCLSYNNLMNNRVNFNESDNSLIIENNDPILVTYIQNNNINFNTNNNIMSINLKDDNSNKNLLYKDLKENKTQRNSYNYYNNNNKSLNRHKSYANNNLYRNKNILYKKRIKEKNNNNNNNNDSKKDINKSKKIKKIRNNEVNYYKKNFNKNIPLTKRSESKNKKINNNLNYFENINDKPSEENININNEFTINKNVRSQTLNGHPVSNHRIYTKYEENKNCTMEISKNIKKKFYNNYLKDNNSYNDSNIKYNSVKNKNLAINYNANKQKNMKANLQSKNEFSNEINLLNAFMKDFNKEQKELSYLSNYQNMTKEINTQRLPKMGSRRKNINSLVNYNYDNEKFIDSKIKKNNLEEEKQKQKNKNILKNDFNKKNYEKNVDKENYFTNYYKKKNKAYVISKETDNFIMKKMKNINNLEDYYANDINFDQNNNDDSDSIKNIKFLSLQKEKINDKNEKIFKKMKMNGNDRINNNKSNRRKVSYSYGMKKNMKEFLGNSRTINN